MILRRSAEIAEAIAAWRTRYETDRSVTQHAIGAAIGVTQTTVGYHIRRAGWVVPPDIVNARKANRRADMPSSARIEMKKVAATATPPPAVAAPSVWALAAGRLVTTIRHRGRHVEVPA